MVATRSPVTAGPSAAGITRAGLPAPVASRPIRRGYAGLSPQARRAIRRETLLQTALDCFGTQGVGATSITSLCTTSGVAARYFYEEFGSIEGLLLALHDTLMDDCFHTMERALAEMLGQPPLPRTPALLNAYVGWVAADPRRARIFVEVVPFAGEILAHRRDAVQRFAQFIEEATMAMIPDGVQVRPQRYSYLFLVAGVQRTIEEWIADPNPCPPEELVSELVFLFDAVQNAAIT